MKVLTYRDRGNGTTTYIDRVEDDYQRPHATPHGLFLEMEIVDDSIYEMNGELFISFGSECHYFVHSSRKVSQLDDENTFYHLLNFNKKLHELYGTQEATARFIHLLEGLKVSPFNFLQWVIEKDRK